MSHSTDNEGLSSLSTWENLIVMTPSSRSAIFPDRIPASHFRRHLELASINFSVLNIFTGGKWIIDIFQVFAERIRRRRSSVRFADSTGVKSVHGHPVRGDQEGEGGKLA